MPHVLFTLIFGRARMYGERLFTATQSVWNKLRIPGGIFNKVFFVEGGTEICLIISFFFYFGQLQQSLYCEPLLLFLFYGAKSHEYLSDRKMFRK